jgi:hypothetical protein
MLQETPGIEADRADRQHAQLHVRTTAGSRLPQQAPSSQDPQAPHPVRSPGLPVLDKQRAGGAGRGIQARHLGGMHEGSRVVRTLPQLVVRLTAAAGTKIGCLAGSPVRWRAPLSHQHRASRSISQAATHPTVGS